MAVLVIGFAASVDPSTAFDVSPARVLALSASACCDATTPSPSLVVGATASGFVQRPRPWPVPSSSTLVTLNKDDSEAVHVSYDHSPGLSASIESDPRIRGDGASLEPLLGACSGDPDRARPSTRLTPGMGPPATARRADAPADPPRALHPHTLRACALSWQTRVLPSRKGCDCCKSSKCSALSAQRCPYREPAPGSGGVPPRRD
ncbi:hypothetical protein L226DRAFT_173788 [Lentinus tigrinus ALCF2SS1-7]|uniref:uncharacterized protein n=1 Tax=Lentinus tigrinus ALCF2SS1-7 TaxID=1328758 RepID=UPI0011663180|nr:hypothetical protein L226DRAFT_173788 [Lentinus tigrinus ALCF2SS1-7]